MLSSYVLPGLVEYIFKQKKLQLWFPNLKKWDYKCCLSLCSLLYLCNKYSFLLNQPMYIHNPILDTPLLLLFNSL